MLWNVLPSRRVFLSPDRVETLQKVLPFLAGLTMVAVAPPGLGEEPAGGSAGRVAFTSSRGEGARLGVYAMDPDGKNVRRLAKSEARYEYDPDLSPDGKRVAFVGFIPAPEGTDEEFITPLFVAEVGGSEAKRITEKAEIACAPRWSPDGKRIAFCVTPVFPGDKNKPMIYTVNPDGTDRKKLGEGLFPFWSPDGKRLGFVSLGTSGEAPPGPLSVMNADGSDRRVLVEGGVFFPGDWSPDGERIVYTGAIREHEELASDLFVIGADGKGKKRLTDTPEMESGPRWAPDGKSVLFARQKGGDDPEDHAKGAELFSVVVETGKETRLTTNKAFEALQVGIFWMLFQPASGE